MKRKDILVLVIVMLLSIGCSFSIFFEKNKEVYSLNDSLKYEYNIFQLAYTLEVYASLIGESDALVHIKVDDADSVAKHHQDSLLNEIKEVVSISEKLRDDLEKLHRIVEKSKSSAEGLKATRRRLGGQDVCVILNEKHDVAKKWKAYESFVFSKVNDKAFEKLNALSFESRQIKISFNDSVLVDKHDEFVREMQVEEFDLYLQLIQRRVIFTELIAIEAINDVG